MQLEHLVQAGLPAVERDPSFELVVPVVEGAPEGPGGGQDEVSVSKAALTDCVGSLSLEQVDTLDTALRIALELDEDID
jgi:mRNA-degrading endonuclease toxin of MazEF toxin-antitoxin module